MGGTGTEDISGLWALGVRIDIYAYVGIFKHARIYNCDPAFGMFVWIWGCVKYGVKCLSPCIL